MKKEKWSQLQLIVLGTLLAVIATSVALALFLLAIGVVEAIFGALPKV